MKIHIALEPVLALISGLLIITKPELMKYVVAAYLIVIGIVGLVG